MVEARGELRIRTGCDHADGDDARHIAGDGERHGTGEEDATPQPGGLVEVGVAGRECHQRKKRPQTGTRLGDIDGEGVRSTRNDRRPLTHRLEAETVQHRQRTSTAKACAPREMTAVPSRTASKPKPFSTASAVPLARYRRWIVTMSRKVASGMQKSR